MTMWQYNHTPSPDELYHYGVVGMKWGKRKAAMRGEKYVYNSHSTNKYNRKVARLNKKKNLSESQAAKLKKYSNRAKRSAQHDRNMEKLADKTSAGKALGAEYLLGTGNVHGYMQSRAAGKGVGRSAAGVLLGGQVTGMRDKAKYIRQDEIKAKQQKKNDINNIRKEINAKSSTAGRIYNRLTDADKYQAEIMYDERKKKKR